MDETKFKITCREMNPLPCIFRKAILSNKFNCEKVQRLNIAERETVNCSSNNAYKICFNLLNLLEKNSQVALHLTNISTQFTHSKAMKIQCGGLLGIQNSLESNGEIINIYSLLQKALLKFQNLENLPYQNIIGKIIHYEIRKRQI
ncbi:MAG TPA: hypothetical protein ENJ27_00200 [Candidatus Moranbacteria bacterium]|nr:hypothetical protein [Candidatus Moranbacteria bacterium]